MSNAAHEEASPEDREHFFRCGTCAEWLDCRNLDEVFEHETHKPRPDIPYGGSEQIHKDKQ